MESHGATTLLSIAGFDLTNTFAATLLVDAVIVLVVILVRRRLALVPGKLQAAAESVVTWLQGTVEQVAGDRARMIFPWVAVFFLYIVISNLIGLMPGFGSIGFWAGEHFVPLFYANTADLNQTLALAIVSVVASNALAVRAKGLGGHLQHFFPLSLLLPVGLLELVQEVTKFITFSFRLYGNISAGEQVIGTMSGILPWVLPLPFLAFEILVAVIQGLIFALLTLAFMTILTEPHHKED